MTARSRLDANALAARLVDAQEQLRVLVEQMKEGAITLTEDGVILYCNESFSDLAGSPSSQIVGGNLFDYIEERAQLKRMLASRSAGESAELNLLTPSGASPVNLSVVELTVEEGAGRMLCSIVTDLRQNYLRAQELASANARLAGEIAERTKAEESLAIALDAADMGNWELSLKEDSAARSARHDAIFGHEPMLSHWGLADALEHFVPEDRDAVRIAFEAVKTTGRIEFERRIRRANDGALRWVHVKGRTLDSADRSGRVAGVIVDITERRLIDEQLRQAQKMEAVGQLTGGIAHDFNNLLMIIGGSLEALSRRVTLEPRAKRLLEAAQLGVARGAKLNEQLLSFARRQDMHVEPICVNDLLPNFETLLDRAVGETVIVEVMRGEDLWHCATDPHQLETAILNLAINARDAMGPGGILTLSTANKTLTPLQSAPFDATAGDYVIIALSDTGSGMTPDVIARVFEPFFTTKEIGKGTGLGLSQVYGFAKQSGGFVSIESVLEKGTTVAIYLPRIAAPTAAGKETEVAEIYAAHGVVLLVEDDADVRAASCAMLEELGYSVRQAASAIDALDVLRREHDIDVVFTDVIMAAGMTGIELAREIKAQWPRLPVLLTSGYTAQRLASSAMNDDLILLRKPYTIEDLAEILHQTIQSREFVS